MKSTTTLQNLFGSLTTNSGTNNLALGLQLINDETRRVCADRDWDFLQKTATDSTVASQQFYYLPYDYDELIDVTIVNGTTKYTPRECPSREQWDLLNQQTTYSSNFPEWYFVFNGQIGFWPIPSTSTSSNITYAYRRKIIDLSIADYTTGTVDAVTSGSTSVTGSGTSWNSTMVGRYIKINPTGTAFSSGDGNWYEITAAPAATTLTLRKAYNGTTLTAGAGATYTIAQISPLPEAFQDLPVYRAVVTYYTSVQPEATRAQLYEKKAESLYDALKRTYGNKTTDPTINATQRWILNPNLNIFF